MSVVSATKGKAWLFGLVLLIFFVISLLTNILGPLIPNIIDSFRLSLGLAGFLPFSFFVAYGVMSVPAGILVEKYSEKSILLAAFVIAFMGALAFACFPTFQVALLSLFFIGAGMAMLQVVVNPLLREVGGEAHFAFNSVLAQLFFGLASFLSPWLYSYLVQNIHGVESNGIITVLEQVVPVGLEWVSLYWVFTAIALAMIVLIASIRFPKVKLTEEEKIGAWNSFQALLKNPHTILFFAATFAYVGLEQGIATWMSKFLQIYHGLEPETAGASSISWFWGLMTLGCLLGLFLLKLMDSRIVLIGFAGGAMISLALALFGPTEIAVIAFPLTGFFASVMWSVIISLGLNSVSRYQGTLAGIMCTGIIGGAVFPLVIGGLSEIVGLRGAMCFLFVALGYILSIGFWAKPLVPNAVIQSNKKAYA